MKPNYNFVTPFAMRCDREQFKTVENNLEGIGYKPTCFSGFKIDSFRYLRLLSTINGFVYTDGVRDDIDLVIETFNRPLLLALAAMTDKADGIKGEWFKGLNGKLIEKKDDTDIASISVKATATELIEHFTKVELPKFTAEEFKKIQDDFEREWNNNNQNLGIIDDHINFDIVDKGRLYTLETKFNAALKRIDDLEYNVRLLTANMDKLIQQPQPEPTKLADKQEVTMWSAIHKGWRLQGFYDAINDCAFNYEGKRNGIKYQNYEPIPADQIPQWMKDAKNKLQA